MTEPSGHQSSGHQSSGHQPSGHRPLVVSRSPSASSSAGTRVLLIGRRFWPHGSEDSAAYLIGLATELSRRGLCVDVLTPQYAPSWPVRVDFRGITVHRPVSAPRFDGMIARDWSVNRYVRLLMNWIREHGRAYDVLLIDRAQEEALAAIDAAKQVGCATIIRVGGWQQDSDLRWWESSRSAGRCMAMARRADAIVAKSSADQRALIAAAFDGGRLTLIDDGFDSGIKRSKQEKIELRRALASINGDLAAPADMPVSLCCAPMNSRSGLRMFVESARVMISRFPQLHFWFIGDGPDRDWIHDYLRGEGVRDSVAMPGSFSEMRDLFLASDVYVQCGAFGLDSFLRQAVSAELPVVSVDDESTRSILTASPHAGSHRGATDLVAWFQAGKIKSLRVAMRSVLDDYPASLQRAQTLRRIVCRDRPHHRAVDQYAALIHRLASRGTDRIRVPGDNSRSIETAS